jgi:hypothetical protein
LTEDVEEPGVRRQDEIALVDAVWSKRDELSAIVGGIARRLAKGSFVGRGDAIREVAE